MLRPAVLSSILVCTLALALPGSAPAGGPPPLEPGDLIGSTGGAGFSIIDLDPMTGAGNLRFGVMGDFPITALEFRSDGVLFATQGGGGSSVLTIDPATGAETPVGAHAFGAVNGLQFIGNTLYGAFFSAGAPDGGGDGQPVYDLVIIDQTDGSLTPVGAMADYAPIRGLAYDESTSTLYGIGVPVLQPKVGGPEGVSDVLFTIDPATAATTEVGAIGFLLGGIEFGPDGVLYGGEAGVPQVSSPGTDRWSEAGAREGVGSASLVSIDTSTGAGTAVGPTGFSAISALAFFPDQQGPGPGQSVLEIPTVGRLGLVLLALLVAGAGLIAVRRS